jgi:hypothetical protein
MTATEASTAAAEASMSAAEATTAAAAATATGSCNDRSSQRSRSKATQEKYKF